MNTDLKDFEEFMKQRDKAANAYVCGDIEPLSNITASSSPVTFFSPRGDYVEGADEVLSRYKSDAVVFEKGSESTFQVFHMSASEGIAYWVGLQKAVTRMHGKDEPVRFDLRVTEIFRCEGNDWKLIHRHADPLAPDSKKK